MQRQGLKYCSRIEQGGLGGSLLDVQGAQSQKEGHQDQGEVNELAVGSPGLSSIPSGSSLDSLALHETSLRNALLKAGC
jgi:hypothetical protein